MDKKLIQPVNLESNLKQYFIPYKDDISFMDFGIIEGINAFNFLSLNIITPPEILNGGIIFARFNDITAMKLNHFYDIKKFNIW